MLLANKVHTTNYFNTFIAVAPDTVAKASQTPPNSIKCSVARKEWEILSKNPYTYTGDDIAFMTRGMGFEWDEFFARGQACFRTSALCKRYGYGIHFDNDGKIALIPMESEAYKLFLNDANIKQTQSMRNKKNNWLYGR